MIRVAPTCVWTGFRFGFGLFRAGIRLHGSVSIYHLTAMSHLNTEQLEDLRQRLLAARASAKALLDRSVSGSGPVEASGQTIGRLTRMDALQVQMMGEMSRHQLEIRLQQIEASLSEWDAGSFGICRSCKEPIGIERLEVLPEAPFCIDCQEGFES